MYTVEEFVRRAMASRGLICYGTGKRFQVFVECFQGTQVLDKVAFCVDRDARLHGSQVSLGARMVDVLPIETLTDIKEKGMVLLITNVRYQDVLSDLSAKGLLPAEEDCFCFKHLYGMILEEQAMTKTVPADCRLTENAVIPKVIHYCWFGRNPIPEHYQRWMESWRKYCPDYEIKEWNEDNYDITKNQYMYEAYEHKKWGFVPDYARLDIIYEHGGIYLDTDVELVGNLDDLRYQMGFAGFERPGLINLGLGFGAARGLPIIRRMRDAYNDYCFVRQDGTLNLTASPVYQTDFLLREGLNLNGEYQKLGDFVIYPEKMLSGKCPYTRRIRLAPYTKSIHHFDASWVDDAWKERNRRFEAEMNEADTDATAGGLVSVIIPAYNVEQYIDQCLESVTGQTYRNLEIILINDGSTDETEEHCRCWAEWDSRIHYISKANEGLGATRNYGLSMAHGDYILFVDTDDWLEIECIEKMHRLLVEEQADICLTEHYRVSGEEKYHRQFEPLPGDKLSDLERKKLILFTPPSAWGKLYRQSFLSRISYEQPSCVFEDTAVYPYVISQAERICCVHEPLWNYRENNAGSIMHKWYNYSKLPQAFAYGRGKMEQAGCLEKYEYVLEHLALHHFAAAYNNWQGRVSREEFRTYFEKPFGQFLQKNYPDWRQKVYTGFFVWGSFAMRWLARKGMLKYAKLVRHYPFSSIISQFLGKGGTYSVRNENPFRRQTVEADIRGSGFENISQQVGNKKQTVLFVDFMEERYPVIHTAADVYMTQSEALKESVETFAEDGCEVIVSGSERFLALWREACGVFVSCLRNELSGMTVILIRSRMAEWYGVHGKEEQFPNVEEIRRYNQMFSQMEDYFLKLYPEAKTIELPEELLYTDVNGKYGCYCWYWNKKLYGNRDFAMKMLQWGGMI